MASLPHSSAGLPGLHDLPVLGRLFGSKRQAALRKADAMLEAAIDAGADIYIEKSSGAQEIGNALRALINADGGFEELTPADNKLSKRQKQLIVMLDRGLSNREIADELGISLRTLRNKIREFAIDEPANDIGAAARMSSAGVNARNCTTSTTNTSANVNRNSARSAGPAASDPLRACAGIVGFR